MLGEPENQLALTRAAVTACGAQPQGCLLKRPLTNLDADRKTLIDHAKGVSHAKKDFS
jgi:hypothetical protein